MTLTDEFLTEPAPSPRRRRRGPAGGGARPPRPLRPAVNAKLAAVAVGIIAVSVAGAAALVTAVSGTSPVVAAARPLSEGQIIAADDLTTVAVSAEPSVPLLPADALPSLIGQRAASDLPAGALLAPGSVTSDPVPGPGRSLLGIQAGSAQAPLEELAPGTPVRLVHVPPAGGPVTGPAEGPSRPVPAQVVSSGTDAAGARVIDVTLAAGDAPLVAGWAAAGAVAVVVDTEAAP